MQDTPKGLRLHIGIFGRRNVGKSSLVNALIGQSIAIVSEVPGTTTDPVEKAVELSPIGPVLFIDTAGIDDVGALGALRRQKTLKVLERADVALLVTGPEGSGEFEDQLIAEFHARAIPFLVVFNKSDLAPPAPADLQRLQGAGAAALAVSAARHDNIDALKAAIAGLAPGGNLDEPHLLGDGHGLVLPDGALGVELRGDVTRLDAVEVYHLHARLDVA